MIVEDTKLRDRLDAYVRANRLANSPVWNTKLASDDHAAAVAWAKEHPTHENLVNAQRLKRIVDLQAQAHRATFKVVGEDK